MTRRPLSLSILAALLLASTVARAQVIAETAPPPFPDPKKFSKGFFIQGELGALAFVGNTAKYAGPGPMFSLRLGYDITRWFAVQLRGAAASSEANLPAPNLGQSFQAYLYGGEAKFSVGIRRARLFLQAGAAAAQLSSNVLQSVGVTRGLFSLAVMGGVGFDYHTLNRHFSLGVNVDYIWMQRFSNTHAIATTAYLKYTH